MKFFPPLGSTAKILGLLNATGLPIGEFEFPIWSADIEHAVFLRVLTSDLSAFSQIFIGKEFGLLQMDEPEYILDLGANIGCSSIYFLNRWKTSKVIAVEADPENFPLLVKNLKPYGNRAMPILGAVAEASGFANIQHTDQGHWATTVNINIQSSPKQLTVPAFTLDQIRSWIPGKIKLIKMDIEGSEAPVMAWLCTHLDRFQGALLAVELHGDEAVRQFHHLQAVVNQKLPPFGEYQVIQL